MTRTREEGKNYVIMDKNMGKNVLRRKQRRNVIKKLKEKIKFKKMQLNLGKKKENRKKMC